MSARWPNICACGSPHDNWTGEDGEMLCQMCWEDETAKSWWKMVNLLPSLQEASVIYELAQQLMEALNGSATQLTDAEHALSLALSQYFRQAQQEQQPK